jgi:hypothetical protein
MAMNDPDVGHSLIGVFHEILIQISHDAEPPSNAMIPKEWAIFSKFSLDLEEEGKEYSLVTDIFWPDGSLLLSQTLNAIQPTKNGMAFITRLQAFPMGQQGKVRIKETLTSEGRAIWGPMELEVVVRVDKIPPSLTTSE